MGSFFSKNNSPVQYSNEPPGCIHCLKGSSPGNPGKFEDIHRQFQNLDPKVFEGARINLKNYLSKHFEVTHSFKIHSNVSPLLYSISRDQKQNNGYEFGAFYTGDKRVGKRERYPVLSGHLQPNGNLSAKFVDSYCCRYRVNFSTNIINNKFKNLISGIDYRSDDFTLALTVADPALLKREGLFILHFLQAITSRVTIGAEIAYNTLACTKNGTQKHIALAFRYSTGFRTVSATLSQAGFHVCYHHRQSPQLQMGVEIQSNLKTDTKSRVLYQVNFPRSDLVFTGFVDSNFIIGGILEKKLYPVSGTSLSFSGVLDHSKESINVGIGLNIEK